MAIVAMQGVVDDAMLIQLSTLSRRVVTGLARQQALQRQAQIIKNCRLRQAVQEPWWGGVDADSSEDGSTDVHEVPDDAEVEASGPDESEQ